jgi:hypothetical protein
MTLIILIVMEYKDDIGNKIEKGFYSFPDCSDIFYFTGKYDEASKFPIFEKESRIGVPRFFTVDSVIKLSRIREKGKIEGRIENFREKANWLEERLNE